MKYMAAGTSEAAVPGISAETTETIDEIIPEGFNDTLIDELVGYETISTYNQALRLIPFNRVDNEEFKGYGNQALETIDYWMKCVESPFDKLFADIERVFVNKSNTDVVEDFTKAINNLFDNPSSEDSKEMAKEAIEYYLEQLNENSKGITETNKHIDEFRIQLGKDSNNFGIIQQKLPALQEANEEAIKKTTEELEETQNNVTRLNIDIRKQKLYLEEIDDSIAKAAICCAIPLINIGGGIAMAVYMEKKSSTKKEIVRLKEELDENSKNYTKLNETLLNLNEQLPILSSMSVQVPSLAKLSIKSAEVAQAIKRAWNDVDISLGYLRENVDKLQTIETINRYKVKKLKEKFDEDKKAIADTINKYKNSKLIGVAYDERAKEVFGLGTRRSMSYSYYRSSPQTNLFYMPVVELHDYITKIRAKRGY